MSVLTKKEIIDFIKTGKLNFQPNLDGFQIQPHAIDLRLGYTFYLPKTWEMTKLGREVVKVDPLDINHNGDLFEKINLKNGQFFEIMPKEFIIATSLEKIKLNNGSIMGILYPRSSINRRGLSVDLSGIIDAWYNGNLMIPIVNNTETQTIRIYPGERFCQVTFETLNTQLNRADAMRHGLQRAKYVGSNEQTIGSKSDKKREIELIKNGKMKELKSKYKIK